MMLKRVDNVGNLFGLLTEPFRVQSTLLHTQSDLLAGIPKAYREFQDFPMKHLVLDGTSVKWIGLVIHPS